MHKKINLKSAEIQDTETFPEKFSVCVKIETVQKHVCQSVISLCTVTFTE